MISSPSELSQQVTMLLPKAIGVTTEELDKVQKLLDRMEEPIGIQAFKLLRLNSKILSACLTFLCRRNLVHRTLIANESKFCSAKNIALLRNKHLTWLPLTDNGTDIRILGDSRNTKIIKSCPDTQLGSEAAGLIKKENHQSPLPVNNFETLPNPSELEINYSSKGSLVLKRKGKKLVELDSLETTLLFEYFQRIHFATS